MANNLPSSGAQPLRPPAVGSMAPQGYGSTFPMQFRPASQAQQGQPFASPVSGPQQFHHVGQAQSIGMPLGQSPASHFSQPMQQFPPRPGHTPPSSQVQMSYAQAQPVHMPGLNGPGVPFSSSYTFPPSPLGQPIQPSSQMHAPIFPNGEQHWMHPGNQSIASGAPTQQTGQQSSVSATSPGFNNSSNSQQSASDWQEYEASDGRRYYYNKITKQSSWEKPLELMTPLERADASTPWKEFTTPEGRKYYYNKETKESKWTIPEALKLAREQADRAALQGAQSEMGLTSNSPAVPTITSVEQTSPAVTSVGSSIPSIASAVAASPIPVTPAVNTSPVLVSESTATPPAHSTTLHNDVSSEREVVTPSAAPGSTGNPVASAGTVSAPVSGVEDSAHGANSVNGSSVLDTKENKTTGLNNSTHVEEKTTDDEPLVYANKQEAKSAFKALLESANVAADWSWDQAMRVIINDKRYGALKTLGERKQAFNEYLMQRKKLEAEERRLRQRKAKEDFIKMLEESKELTSSTRWSKAATMFEEDERFKAVDRESDREDLFRNYLVDLQKKERIKAQEEYRQNRLEYRHFLETCDFIKVDSQWRKVQDLLEDDERCSRLDKFERLEIFQDYIRDLEKEEEEHRKIQKEQQRRIERKNRDAFRKMMEEHIACGALTAKTVWHDYCQKVKDSDAYQAVASNISGSTPKDLFEDVVEELENQYHDDKTRVKDVLKLEKITVISTWTFEDFKDAVKEGIGSPSISDTNLLLVFEDLIERAKEKEEKEVKKRQRLLKDFTDKLSTIKEITASSSWEECKELVEESSEYKSIGEESLCRETFEEYVGRLREKAKEKERKREEEKAKKEKEREEKERKKDKERKEKERERDEKEKEKERERERDREREREREKGKERSRKDEAESESADATDSYGYREERKREKEKDRKHRKRRHGSVDDVSSEKDEKEDSKKSRRHGSDRRKSKKHAYSPDSDSEGRHKKHKRDHWDGSRKHNSYEELEDGEVGEDGEIR